MRLAFYTVCISPHQLPLARELVKHLGSGGFRYVCHESVGRERVDMGWGERTSEPWVLEGAQSASERQDWLEHADVLFSYIRDTDLFVRRQEAGLTTYYCSERWLKPNHGIPGWLRLFHYGYYRMVRRFVRLFDCPRFRYLPQGRWAERDMAFLCCVMGRTMPPEKVIPWGYFVAPSSLPPPPPRISTSKRALRVLWVGRMIGWKRVDTIIKAIKSLPQDKFSLTLVGNGDKRKSLVRLAAGSSNIMFKDSIPIAKIRGEMRAHDVYVLSSNGEEGWGAALNEAMEEGMMTLGTFEAGASSCMLPDSHKFHAGDWRRLADLLQKVGSGKLDRIPVGFWSAKNAAIVLLKEVGV